MALKDTVKSLRDLLNQVTHDLEKADKGNKAASQRVRTGTVKMEKIAKHYRKESIKNEKSTKSSKKPAKKAAPSKKAKPVVKHSMKAKAKTHKTKARPMSLKRPTAKLPTKQIAW
jgi:hypothetical protein